MKNMKKMLSWVLAVAMLLTNVTYVGAAETIFSEAEAVMATVSGGNVTAGDASPGDVTAGDVFEGDVTEGDVTEGDATEGDVTEGDATEDDVTEGDITGNDISEGDVSGGDAEINELVHEAASTATVLYSGEIHGITWEITDGGLLTIAGDDTSESALQDTMPWLEYKSSITKVVVTAKNVKDTYRWFINCTGINEIDLTNFDTSKVTDMSEMFINCSSLTTLDVSRFDTSKVTNMSAMFCDCSGLTSLNLSGFDTSNVTDMSYMFEECSSLTSLDVSGFDTSKVKNMNWMFVACRSLTSLDVSSFDTSNIRDMGSMFYDCSRLTSLDVSGFDTSNVTDMGGMFESCSSLISLDVSGFDTSKVTHMNAMFNNCSSLPGVDVSGFDTTNAKYMTSMFAGCRSLISLNVSGFSTSNVIGMKSMFSGCSSLTDLDVSGFNTSNVLYMGNMFKNCSGLTSLDVSGFDTSKVTDIDAMFEGCNAITHIKSFPNLNLSVDLPVSPMHDASDNSYTKFPKNLSKGIDLYAVYKVTFDSALGTESVKVINVRVGGTITLPENPTRDGYIFGGWFTEQNGGGTQVTAKTVVEEDLYLYAFWYHDGFWTTEVAPQTYTGKAIKPVVQVYDGNKRLTEKVDYTISYKNNTKANDASDAKKAPTIIVKGKGNYTGKETIIFQILKKDLAEEDITVKGLMAEARSKVQKPVPTLTYNGKKLKNKTDFTVSYPDLDNSGIADAYKAPGTYTIRVEGKGNFKGVRNITFTITGGILMSKVKIASIPNQEYAGYTIEPEIKVTYKGKTLKKNKDYTVEYKKNGVVGKATVVVTGRGDYVGTKEATFTITGTSIAKAQVSGIVNKTYTGNAQTQMLTVTLNNATLKAGKDYDVTYSKNTDAGTASIVITGKKNYTGTIKKTFKITPYDIKEDEYKLVSGIVEKLSVSYTKGGSTPTLDLSFNGTELVAKKDYTISYSNNKKVASATDKKAPTIKITGKGNFKGTITVPFNIIARELRDRRGSITINVPDVAYSAKAGKYISKPVLTDSNGKKLVAGTDYEKTITYTLADGTVLNSKKDAPQAGTVIKVTVTGKGNYTGTLESTYKITQASFKSAKIKITAQEYTGSGVTLDPEDLIVKIGKTELKYGQDYVIVENSYKNNMKKGTASVTIRGVGNYGGEKTVKFKIASKKLVWFWNLF